MGMQVEARRVSLSPKVVRELLAFMGDTKLGYDGGEFVARLLRLVAVADRENRARLAMFWPEYVVGFEMANRPWGVEWLRGLAKSMNVGDVEALDLLVEGRP